MAEQVAYFNTEKSLLPFLQVNFIVALLSIDFHSLESDVRKEFALRSKMGSAAADSILVPSLNLAPALEFERSDATRRLRLVLSELIVIMGQVGYNMDAILC